MFKLRRTLAAFMAVILILTALPFGLAEEAAVELSEEAIAQLIAAPEEPVLSEEPAPVPEEVPAEETLPEAEEPASAPEADPAPEAWPVPEEPVPEEEALPEATEEPAAEPSPELSAEPTSGLVSEESPAPEAEPSEAPAELPTAEPNAEVSAAPSEETAAEPAPEATPAPEAEASPEPEVLPSEEPAAEPSEDPAPEATEKPLPATAEELAAAVGMSIEELAAALECSVEELLAMDASQIAGIYAEHTVEAELMESGDFQIENGVLKKYSGSDEHVVIPDGVTTIAKNTFLDNKTIRSVVIPASVKSIENSGYYSTQGAFQNCTNLETVVFQGNKLNSIGVNAFRGCARLENIILPAGLKRIEAYAFQECDKLNSISIPEGVEWIGEYAFYGCSDLESAILPSTLASTGDGVFYGCDLKEITIPGSLKVIQKQSFYGCKALRRVVIQSGVESIEDSGYYNSQGAFQDCSELRSVEIQGSSLTYIGYRTFEGCSRLESAILPASLESIGAYAFKNCQKLESINLPEGVEWIGEYAFQNCYALESINLPSTLASTGNGAFCYSGLEEITIPGSLEVIQKQSFYGCGSLRKVVIQNGVESIEDSGYYNSEGAFQECSQLRSVEIQGSSLRYIGYRSFQNCTRLESVILPASLESIGAYAFVECSSLASINLSEGLEWIGEYGFKGCSALRTIKLPSTLTSTGDTVFCASGLEEITIPGCLELIQKESFLGCKSLRKVIIQDGVEGIESSGYYTSQGAFQGCISLETVEIQGDSFLSIGIRAFQDCPKLKNVTLPDGLEKILAYAFSGCTGLENITLPESVEEFGDNAFSGCKNATLWVYPESDSLAFCEKNAASQGFKYKIIGSEPTLSLKGSAPSLSFGKDGGSMSFEIASNTDWTISAPAWLAVSPAKGSGNATVTISVSANAYGAREGSIVISAAECESIALPVYQQSGCEHAYLYLCAYDADGYLLYAPEDAEYTAVDAASHSYTAYVSRKTLECMDCGTVVEEIPVNDYLSFTESHAFWEGGDGKGGCYYCHFKASKGCKHPSYSREVKAYESIDAQRHFISGYTLADGYYSCKLCGYIGDGRSWGYSDWEIIEGSVYSRIEPHTLVNGACACGYSFPKIEFTTLQDGDPIEINTRAAVSWSCEAYDEFIVNVKLLSGEPNPGSNNEPGESLFYQHKVQGEGPHTFFFDVPDAAGQYIKFHVQAAKDGELTSTANQLYLKIIDKNQITLSGGDTLTAGKSATLKALDMDGKAISAKKLKWTTSDKAVATVSSAGKVTAKKAGVVTITATAKDGTYGFIEITIVPKATGVTITIGGEKAPSTAAIDLGSEITTLQLGAVVAPEAANQNVSWKSSNAKVAKVSADGLVTAVKAGTATITATTKDGTKKTDTIKISVGTSVKGIEITGKQDVTAGKSITLKAVVTPSNATNKAVTWSSSDKTIATVSASGKVTAKKIASPHTQNIIISAKAKDGSGAYAEYEIYVHPAATGVKLYANGEEAKTASVSMGETLQLTASVLPEHASQKVKWSSSSTKVARVDANGMVTPVKTGTVTITAKTENGKKATCKVKVEKALDTTPASDFEYQISGGAVTVTKYVGNAEKVSIPAKIENLPVTVIGDGCFRSNENLLSIVIPSTVTAIGSEAFYGCKGLESIVVPSSVTSIGDAAFYYCQGLVSIKLPGTVHSIGAEAFYYCDHLTSFTIPASLTSISDGMFNRCRRLTSIKIPDSITSIGSFAFAECRELKEIAIPDSVTTIGDGAFAYCETLVNATLPSTLTTLGNEIFFECYNLMKISIPDTVTSIGNDVFHGCNSLKNVVIPETVTSIGRGVFRECGNLISVTLPSSITNIGNEMFYCCYSLKNISIPDTVTSIGWRAFRDCYSLAEISIPDSVASIGFEAFESCESLVEITLPASVTSIENSTFSFCYKLKSVSLPNSLVSIERSAFFGCRSLVDIRIPASVASIGSSTFTSCESLERITILGSNTSISSNAFQYCPETLTIHAPAGSLAEEYAKANNIRFEPIDAPVQPETPVKITGSLGLDSIELTPGKVCRLPGKVSITGGTLGYVTLNVDGVEDNYARIELIGAEELSLSTFNEFVIDTSKAPFDQPGTYTLNLWARAENSDPASGVKLDSMTVKVMALEGSFKEDKITVAPGGSCRFHGQVNALNTTLQKVTVSVEYHSELSYTKDFTGAGVSTVNLQEHAEYTLDASIPPFNQPGVYSVSLWAKAEGVGALKLDTMEVVVEKTVNMDELRTKAVQRALQWYDKVWQLEKELTLWSGVTLKAGTWVRGVPYSCKNGHVEKNIDTFFEQDKETMYYALTKDGYGADCVQMVYDCWNYASNGKISTREGFPKKWMQAIDWSDLKPGDILLRDDYPGKDDHIGIVVAVYQDSYLVVDNTAWHLSGLKPGDALPDKTSTGETTYMIGTCKLVWSKSNAIKYGYLPYEIVIPDED